KRDWSSDVCSSDLSCQKLCAGAADIGGCPSLHRRFDGLCNRQQAYVLRQVERPDAVAFEKTCTIRFARWGVCKHSTLVRTSRKLEGTGIAAMPDQRGCFPRHATSPNVRVAAPLR